MMRVLHTRSVWLMLIFGLFATNAELNEPSNVLKDGNLIFAHILFRHGDRTPVQTYPLDPYRDLSEWPTGWGQLTNLGKQQHFILGQWLRKRYDDLVNRTYSRDEVYIRSTDVDRTLMSALSNLAGFYPPVDNDVWNSNLAWQPIPVHTIPEKKDHLLAMKKSCPAYSNALSKLKKSDEFRKYNNQHKQLYEYLTVHTGNHIHDMEGVGHIYSTLFIESLYNKTLPEWTKPVFPKKLKEIAAKDFATATYTRYLARLKAGPLLKEILERSQNKSDGTLKPNRSLWIYSAHDSTVASILNTLKIFEYHTPPYRSCVMFELRELDGNYFMSVFYKNSTGEPQLMDLPDCGSACPLEKMFELYEDVLPGNWEAECKESFLDEFSSSLTAEIDSTGYLAIIGAFVTIFLIVLLIIEILIFYKRRDGYSKSYKQMQS